ncbi:MAG: DNA repair protein RadA [Candidatus Uhrbacteria bacterium]|nr:DNA repair protein RadA [Candidatus Uhrbacteria bacterium]
MYRCTKCDAQSLKWLGRCTECSNWGTLVEDGDASSSSVSRTARAKPAPTLNLSAASITTAEHRSSGISELDRVLGGGIVPGSVTLLAGEPGVGKSTLVAQIAAQQPSAARSGQPRGVAPTILSYYASGEESEGQVLMRFKRLGLDPGSIAFSNAVEVGGILAAARELKPSIVIVDSIQTMLLEDADALPGTPTAVRAATAEIISFAKSTGIAVLIIGQVTKDGNVAGPKTLEHLVDTVLTLEGDPDSSYRLLRAAKNRFGSTEEVGVFEMTERGMIAVENPSAMFLKERVPGPGSVVTCVMEGTRPFLVEIQALVDRSFFPNPVRRTSGYDASRLQMLLAIIGKRAGIKVYDQDVFVNVVGGMKVKEPAVDLAVAAAIISAIENISLPEDAIVLGELGLGGELRTVPFLERRLKEAERLGLKSAITPKHIRHLNELAKHLAK